MSLLINASIAVDKLPKEKFVKAKNGRVYYQMTISVNDQSRFGNNVWIYDSQSKEEREAKKNKHTLGNGAVVWTDGNVVVAEKDEKKNTDHIVAGTEDAYKKEDLPF
jgi:hypothetical protein|tara:strand:+ start:40 stop:360 length:321 start_codon:yes stop_codon:yes gene_type:complete